MKTDKATLSRWNKYACLMCRDNGVKTGDILTGAMAWSIAHKLDIPREAYHMGLNDKHISTALKRIFPNAIFKN